MSGWLLDTNILSALRRGDRTVAAFVAARPLARLYVSDVTLAEIRWGIETVPDMEKRAVLKRWLDQDVRPVFSGRCLAVSEDVILAWLTVAGSLRKRGITVAQQDGLIAATAMFFGLTVVTADTAPFAAFGCDIIDPWHS